MDYEESSSPQRLQLSDNLYEGEQYDPVSPEVVVLDSDSDGRNLSCHIKGIVANCQEGAPMYTNCKLYLY